MVMDYSPPILAKPTTRRIVRGPVNRAPVQASAHIDAGDDVEPGQFDADTAALIAALADFTGEIWAEAEFDESKHLRGPGGKFRNMFGRIQRALADWSNGDGAHDPLAEFKDRAPLMDAAKKRGVPLKRGASRDEIVRALLDDIRDKRAAARGEEAPPKPSHRLTLSSPRYRDQDVGVYAEKDGKVSLYREASPFHRGSKVVTVDSLADLEAWGRDHDEPQVAKWAASERGGGKPAVKKVAPRKAPAKAPAAAIQQRERGAREQREALGITGEPTETDARMALSRLSKAQLKKAFAQTNTGYVLTSRASLTKLGDKRGKAFGTTATEEQLVDALIAEVVGQARRDAGHDGPRLAHAELVDVALEIHPAAPSTPRKAPAKRVPATPAPAKAVLPGAPQTDLTPDEQARARRLIRQDPQILASIRDRFGRVSTSGNLSQDDAAWLESVAKRDRVFVEHLAQDAQIQRMIGEGAKKAGQSPSEYRAAVSARLKELLADKPIAVRVRDDAALRDILSGGRFKTSLEGARRTAGLGSDSDRRRLGEHIMGVTADTPASERPVYGYVAVSGIEPALSAGRKLSGFAFEREGQEDVLSSYGEIQVVLKPEVRTRTTATVGDSLDEIWAMRPTPVDNPGAESLGFHSLDSVIAPGFTRQGYVEAQIHGGVRADDISEVVFPAQPTSATVAALDARGIPWRVLGRDGTSTAGPSPAKAVPSPADPLADLRTMDTESARDALDLRKVPELKAMLKAEGLPVSGNKRALVDRLVEHLGGEGGPKGEAPGSNLPPARRAPATPVPIHDLIDADDATITAALRDVYEGQFGPYTTKIQVGIRRAGTRTDSRGREQKIEPSIWVEGKIYDKNGHEIGNFGRAIGPTDRYYGDVVRREVWAEHDIVQLGNSDEDRGKYQGKGFGGAFNRRVIDWYRASGVHGIAQDDHNFYVWASQGFGFRGGIVPKQTSEAMSELIADLRAGKTKNRYGEPIPKALREAPDLDAQIAAAEAVLARLESTQPGQPGYPTAYEVSQLGRRPGQRGKTATWFGKVIPVPADELILNPDEGEVIS